MPAREEEQRHRLQRPQPRRAGAAQMCQRRNGFAEHEERQAEEPQERRVPVLLDRCGDHRGFLAALAFAVQARQQEEHHDRTAERPSHHGFVARRPPPLPPRVELQPHRVGLGDRVTGRLGTARVQRALAVQVGREPVVQGLARVRSERVPLVLGVAQQVVAHVVGAARDAEVPLGVAGRPGAPTRDVDRPQRAVRRPHRPGVARGLLREVRRQVEPRVVGRGRLSERLDGVHRGHHVTTLRHALVAARRSGGDHPADEHRERDHREPEPGRESEEEFARTHCRVRLRNGLD